jgi:hypothetical protein
MRNLILTVIPVILLSCGISDKERMEIATITCNILSESKNIDAVLRIQEVNKARELLGEERFLEKDTLIKEAFFYDLCKELVLNDSRFPELLDLKRKEFEDLQDSITKNELKILEGALVIIDSIEKNKLDELEKRRLEQKQKIEIIKQEKITSKNEWKKSVLELLKNYSPSRVTNLKYSLGNENLTFDYPCSDIKGLGRRFVIKMNNGLEDIVLEDNSGFCFSNNEIINGDLWKNEHINAFDKVSQNPKSLILSISLEFYGVFEVNGVQYDKNLDSKVYFPQNYKHLNQFERLETPIVYQLKF